MVYIGITCLLVIKINYSRDRLTFSADKFYSDPFLGSYKCSNPPKGEIANYLLGSIEKASSSSFSNMKEGYYQNLICYESGENAKSDSPFIVIDRECVIGYTNSEEKVTHLKPIVDKYLKLIATEKENDPKTYGKSKPKNLGNELDLLALDPEGNLCCIELKNGSNTAGIYWGPFQVAVYKEIFNINAVKPIFQDIQELITQKIALGLLPPQAGSFLKGRSNFNAIRPILGIGDPNPRSTCWTRMHDLMNKHKPLLDCEVIKF
ncbi:MAG: hypothetical protein IPF68_03525 [Bacteroidales bacterium]|nr:hypothetical protein [Bacteroidales bacterium]